MHYKQWPPPQTGDDSIQVELADTRSSQQPRQAEAGHIATHLCFPPAADIILMCFYQLNFLVFGEINYIFSAKSLYTFVTVALCYL